MTLILASQSASRRAMLAAAGVPFEAVAAGVDEDAAKAALAHLKPRDLADALAELKAIKIAQRRPDALVLGSDSDSVVALADGSSSPHSQTLCRTHSVTPDLIRGPACRTTTSR